MVTRVQLKHAIRASCAILEQPGVIVIGSQSILATWPDTELPVAATQSMELDICPLADNDAQALAMVLGGAIGELSPFNEAFGFYIDGVGKNTATLPDDFSERLIAVSDNDTKGYVGFCIDPHDLCVAKLVAGRDKDMIFVDALIGQRFVDPRIIGRFLVHTKMPHSTRKRIEQYLQPIIELWDHHEVRAMQPRRSLGVPYSSVNHDAQTALTAYLNEI